jgi:hypothetical protein
VLTQLRVIFQGVKQNASITGRFAHSRRRNAKTAQIWAMYFVGTLCGYCGLFQTHQRMLESLSPITSFFFAGQTYREMSMTERDLTKYRVDEFIVQKTLTSTSKNRAVAMHFAMHSSNRLAVICIYNITTARMALDIHTISEFPDEEEVLMLPGFPFTVTKISRGNPIEIELHQMNFTSN